MKAVGWLWRVGGLWWSLEWWSMNRDGREENPRAMGTGAEYVVVMVRCAERVDTGIVGLGSIV